MAAPTAPQSANPILHADKSAVQKLGPILTVSLVSSLIMLDSNIVAVSLLAIGRSFATSFAGLQWVMSAYVLVFCALLLSAGDFADLHGRKRAMILGLTVFAFASTGCGLAPSLIVLEISRALQGAGAALLLTSSMAILSHDYNGAERSRAIAIWRASIGVALATGPIAGGVITQFFGWRPIFLINVPICLALMTAARRNITESCRPGAQSIDVPGLLSFSFALALLVHVLISGTDSGWLHPPALAQLACAAMLLAAFVLFERRNAQAMIDIDLFRSKAFVGALLTMTGYGAAIQVLIFLLPLYLQTVYGFAPIIAGLAMVPFAFPMVIAPRFAAQLAGHMSMAGMLSVGLGFGVVGELAMAAAARTTLPYPWFAVGMVLVGCGAGLLNGLTVKAVQEAVPEERAGVASGMAATARFIGILVGVAGLGAVLSNHTSDLFLPATLLQGATPQVAETLSRHLVAGELAAFRAEMPAGITASIYEKGIHAYAGGFAAAMGLAALVAGVTALLAAWLLREPARQPVIQPCMPVDCRHPV